MELYERIQQLRKARGMSQEEMGERVGVSRQAVSKWESGQSVPDVEHIVALAELFGVTTDYLLTGTGGAANVNVPQKVDMRIFALIGTMLNMLGLVFAVGGGRQFATVLSALIFMAVGCMLFGAGLIFATEHKARAAWLFTLVNLWPILFLPLLVVYDQLRSHVWIVSFISYWLGESLAFWLGYVAFCLAATLILLAVWRRKK